MSPPLTGVKVVELGNLIAAPYCGMLLADLGAEVTKVEPLDGDLARRIGPFVAGESVFFTSVNRGKRSLSADLRDARVMTHVSELCARAKVVVHNLRVGALDALGLGYQRLSGINPGLVYAGISAFGADGPYATRAGIDLIFQGESGMMSITGEPGDPPHKTATTIGDFVAGTNAALAVCAALYQGAGRLIDVSLRDGLIAVQAGWNALYFASSSQPPRTGTSSPVTAPNQTFRTGDGCLNVAIVSDRHFRSLCEVIGVAPLANDPRFATNELRVANRSVLGELIEEVLVTDTTDAWFARLDRAGLPVGRLLSLDEVFSDPQVLHNQMLLEMDHPRAGRLRMQGSAIRMGEVRNVATSPPPLLGQHTAEVLAELGVSKGEIEGLAHEGLVVLG
jgi:crotonobetainyl-CoA:carnitine CoA-transferase CaiB-like acyl-CoA transferase